MIFEIGVFCVLILALYLNFKRSFEFWRVRNVPFLQPTFPTGNMLEVVKKTKHFGYVMEDIYRHMKRRSDVDGYCGIFFFYKPTLLVMTPEFAKTVLVRDFNSFVDRGVYSNEEVDALSGNLFFLEGHRWRFLRKKLTPSFTSGKLKVMFHTVFDVGQKFVEHLVPLAAAERDVGIYDMLARFFTDVISSCVFGFEANTLENPENEFRKMGQRGINMSKLKSLKALLAMTFRKRAQLLGVRFFDKDVNDFFAKIVRETIEYRKKSGETRRDFMQILIELMERSDENGEKLTFNEVAAQTFFFYFAGFETSSTTLACALHSLAHNQEIQTKAREVVSEKLKLFDNEWSYEAVMEMTYLEWILEETLRLYAPVATLHRITTKEYTLPNGHTIPKDTGVLIPNLAFQRDPELFPEPLKYDPERFNPESRNSRHSFAHMPFGEGPRICIGLRFSQLQSRLGLALLLKNFKFEPCALTENPIKIDSLKFIHSPKGEIWLKMTRI